MSSRTRSFREFSGAKTRNDARPSYPGQRVPTKAHLLHLGFSPPPLAISPSLSRKARSIGDTAPPQREPQKSKRRGALRRTRDGPTWAKRGVLRGAPLFHPPELLLQFHVEKVAHTVPWAPAEWIRCRANRVQIGSLHMLAILTEGSSKVPPLCELLYNPVGSRETVWPSPGRCARRGRTGDPKCFLLFRHWLFRKVRGEQKEAKPPFKLGVPVSLSTPTQTTSRRQDDPAIRPGHWMGSRMRAQETSSWWPRCPPPAPPRPLVGFSRADVVTAVPGARPLGLDASGAQWQARAPGVF